MMGLGKNFWPRSGRVRSAIFGLDMGWENFPLKIPNFSIVFASDKKNLFWLGQKVQIHIATPSNKIQI